MAKCKHTCKHTRKYIYPAIFTKEETGYSVRFPDLEGCFTQGKDLQDACEMAEDVLCLTLYRMEEDGEEIPRPGEIKKTTCGENEFVSLICCDTIEYREYYDASTVQKTLTLPAWLNKMAEREGLNFSEILEKALKKELNVGDR